MYIQLKFGSTVPGGVRSLLSWGVEVDCHPSDLFFSSSEEGEQKRRLTYLTLPIPRRLIPLLETKCSLELVWIESNGLKLSLNDYCEDSRSIEEKRDVGNLQEFLGAVLSERDRLKRGAKSY